MSTFLIALSLCLLAFLVSAADAEKKSKSAESPRAKMLEKYDKNKDGKIDETEREAWRKDRETETVKKYDRNGDGKLDDAERKAAREQRRKEAENKKSGAAPKKPDTK